MSFEEIKFRSTDKILIVGKSGSGKTTLMKALINANEPSYKQQTFQKYGKAKSYIKVDPLMQFGGTFVRYGDRTNYDKILALMFKNAPEFIVTDEADGFFPNKLALSDIENDFINIGRPAGLGGMFITRRLSRLNTDLVANATKIFMFKLWASADMRYLQNSNFGDFVPTVSRLEPYEFLFIDVDTNDYIVFDPI